MITNKFILFFILLFFSINVLAAGSTGANCNEAVYSEMLNQLNSKVKRDKEMREEMAKHVTAPPPPEVDGCLGNVLSDLNLGLAFPDFAKLLKSLVEQTCSAARDTIQTQIGALDQSIGQDIKVPTMMVGGKQIGGQSLGGKAGIATTNQGNGTGSLTFNGQLVQNVPSASSKFNLSAPGAAATSASGNLIGSIGAWQQTISSKATNAVTGQ